MAGEFSHASVGTELTQTEFESLTLHVVDSQARGDILISDSAATGFTRLAIGTVGRLLRAGASDPEWTSTLTLDSFGQLQVSTTGSGAGILLGGDAQLYRGAADELTVASGDDFHIVSGDLHVDAGLGIFDGDGTRVFSLPTDATDPTGSGAAADGRIPVLIAGVTKYLAYYDA